MRRCSVALGVLWMCDEAHLTMLDVHVCLMLSLLRIYCLRVRYSIEDMAQVSSSGVQCQQTPQ